MYCCIDLIEFWLKREILFCNGSLSGYWYYLLEVGHLTLYFLLWAVNFWLELYV